MPHAILLSSLEARLDEAALGQVLAGQRTLTEYDIGCLARDGCGILLENLSLADGRDLERAMLKQGLAVELVDQDRLPTLPGAKRLKQADCLDKVLVLYDAIGRVSTVEWSSLRLIAAGCVGTIELKRNDFPMPDGQTLYFAFSGQGTPYLELPSVQLVLDILVEPGMARFQVNARQFQYNYLGSRMKRRPDENFLMLVGDLIGRASQAALNRGAAAITKRPPATFNYHSTKQYEREIVWQLWRAGR